MTPALSILTGRNDALAKHVLEQLERRQFVSRREIKIELMDRAGRLTDRQRRAHRLETRR